MSNYWDSRLLEVQTQITNASIERTEAQLAKYYQQATKSVIKDFQALYEKIQLKIKDGREVTANDIYQLDKYWQMESQLTASLEKMGKREIATLTKNFESQYKAIYSTALKGDATFNKVSYDNARAVINAVWCEDGKNFSQRVWGNTTRLAQRLNDELVNCAITGRSTSDLKKQLMAEFGASYSQADTLIRTEMAHIETQASVQRYKDAGVKYYEFSAANDERTCDECSALDGQRFSFDEMSVGINCPPIHPNDRCQILPIID